MLQQDWTVDSYFVILFHNYLSTVYASKSNAPVLKDVFIW